MPKSKILIATLILALVSSAIGIGTLSAQGRKPGPLSLRPLALQASPVAAAESSKTVSIIVQLDEAPLASYTGAVLGFSATSPSTTGQELDLKSVDSLAYLAYLDAQTKVFEGTTVSSIPGARIIHRYRVVLGGVSMLVPADQVKAVAQLPGVKAVYPDTVLHPDTERSPSFIGAPAVWRALGGVEHAGEGVVVGLLDTGIWPEHPSFSDPGDDADPDPEDDADPDPAGHAYPAPPATWTGTACEFGSDVPGDAPFTCNHKLIGAARFMQTYESLNPLLPGEFPSARDSEGHGTHTASTAAGNAGVVATLLGIDRGEISGVAPRAHVAMYKVCGNVGCYVSDSAAAVEQAILDGVDVINFSIGGGSDPYSDAVSLAFLDAYNAGVFVAASAGNDGPGLDTVEHREPWVTTVAASTQDRAFVSTLNLTASNGDKLTLEGASITAGVSTPTPVVLAANFGDALCAAPFPAGTFSGQIVVCERGVVARVAKGYNVQQGGAGGMILYNPSLQGVGNDNHFIPSVHLEVDAGTALLNFLSTHTDVTATFTDGAATRVPGDVMAPFSSRGGPGQTLGISKPDVTAPGVDILAGHTPLPHSIVGGLPGQLFQVIQGTSMSSPHVAGSAALLAALHPDWTPGQIKSALMTTANPFVVKEDGVTLSDPFDRGSGRIMLARAMNPGLTISASGADFVAHENDLWNANYPSVYVPIMPGQVTVQRTIHSELERGAWWGLNAIAPPDVQVSVPHRLYVDAGGDVTFDITVDARNVPPGEVRFATIVLHYRRYVNLIPITIVRDQPNVTLAKSCDPGTLAIGGTTTCTITVENTAFTDANVNLVDDLPRQLRLVNGSVVGGTESGNGVTFSGVIGAAGSPTVDVSAVPLISGYVSLASLGAGPFALPTNTDDGGWIISGVDINYLGQHYDTVIWSVNGAIELGNSSGAAAPGANVQLPNPAIPNNLLAAWWTDLDLTNSGNWYLAGLTDGVNNYTVFEWDNVPRFGGATSTATFQIWFQDGTDGIWFSYGGFTGSTADGTIGAEDGAGLFGDTYYYGEGSIGTPPDGLQDVLVTYLPGNPGETKVITFQATAPRSGSYQNCAEMTGDIWFGTNIACFNGIITP